MPERQNVKALPSVVQYPDGELRSLSKLRDRERASVMRAMSRNAGRQLSAYYSQNLKEWGTFVSIMSDCR